ncbi:N-acetyllactosaminide beta-1,3-N-acetylglucosaminyltransferase 2 [Eucyclogobius newberryi]|uniref:N-acetyllactosaminide beta-1,3-N-acetylglucosaminyltransferase 2 n=1 Tax=Eucyclogobius newberryi TaxID=166745 RepID=UPI003B5C24A2
MGKFCKCNGRLLCMCLLPFMMTGHLLVYILVTIFVTISYAPPKIPVHFIAPGSTANSAKMPPHPLNPFWNLRLIDTALWNRLQHGCDRLYNPILRGNASGMPQQSKTKLLSAGCMSDCTSEAVLDTKENEVKSMSDQMRAFVSSMHCREYPYIINQPGLCYSNETLDSPLLLMAIKSQLGNFENRQAIRETWGRSGHVSGEFNVKGGLVRTVFLLGKQESKPNSKLHVLLDNESRKYGDILLWDFKDTFFNLTLKDVLFWRWFEQYCPKAIFVFKGDDDVFVRTDALVDYLNKQWEEHSLWLHYTNETDKGMDLFMGEVINYASPNRDPSTKYFIPQSFYQGAYPAYAGGGGVVYSGSLALRLKHVSEQVSLFPIDDVYLGMCLRKLGVAPSHHPGFLTFDLPFMQRGNPCAYKSVLLVHRRNPREMIALWKHLRNLRMRC